MSQEKTTLEIIAPTVEEAVARGLVQLGMPRDAVDVEVLDPGARGLLGIGSRQARVRLTIHVAPMASEPALTPAATDLDPRAAPVRTMRDSELPREVTLAREIVHDLLDRMKVRAKIEASYVPAEDDSDEQVVLVDIQGDDLSILIGKRSETLNALQYITSLILCKELGRWVPLMIDVQGYRTRRERSLRQMARKFAEQAIQTGRRQTLEPMPANERRIIHLELRGHDSVITESVGEEPNRKVTITLKKPESK